MKRLTHYNEKDKRYDIKNAYLEDLEQDLKYDGIAWLRIYEAYQELGKLEDIEEELGIDLITLFKALKNGVWTNQEQTYGDAKQGKIRFFKVRLLLEEKSIGCIHNSIWKGEEVTKRLYLKNYGKTWALRKEDLENDKND